MISQVGALSVWLRVAEQAADDAEGPNVQFGGNGGGHSHKAGSLASIQQDARRFLAEVRGGLGDQRAVTAYEIAGAVSSVVQARWRPRGVGQRL